MTSERQTDSGIHVVEYSRTEPPRKGMVESAVESLPERTWRCKQGHLFKNRFPFHLRFLIEGSPVLETEPLCPSCFKAWLENRFETTEVKGARSSGGPSSRRARRHPE